MRTATKTWDLDILPREFVIYNQNLSILNNSKWDLISTEREGERGRVCTVCDFFASSNEAVRVDNDFLFPLDLDDLGATIRGTTMVDKPSNISRLGS